MQPKLILFLVLLFSLNAYAGKLSFAVGTFSMDIESSNGDSTEVSNLGSYRFQYHISILEQLDLITGYNLIMSDIVTGDKSFGPNVGISYCYFGCNAVNIINIDSIYVSNIRNYNPYVAINFHERQFQSVRASYAGFSLDIGCEFGLSKNFTLNAEYRITSLSGPSAGSVSESSIFSGISLYY